MSKAKSDPVRGRGISLPGAHFVRNDEVKRCGEFGEHKKIGRRRITTIRENEQECFDDDYHQRNSIKSKGDRIISRSNIDTDTYEAPPPSASTPPILRTVDLTPLPISTNQESRCFAEEQSVASFVTEHSMTTIQISNLRQRDDATIHTTETTITAQVTNSSDRRKRCLRMTNTSLSSNMEVIPSDSQRRSILTSNNRWPLRKSWIMINVQGRTMSEDEIKLMWLTSGKCTLCGLNQTHAKEKYGPFGIFRRMIPQTIEGISYKGYCLNCYDVPNLRLILHDPCIPLDLLRHNPIQSSLRSLQSLNAGIIEIPEPKRGLLEILFSSMLFQICFFVTLLVVAACIVSLGIKFSKRPEIWISQAPSPAPSSSPSTFFPTVSPTSYEWNFNSHITSDIESFGHIVRLSAQGDILVVYSPNFKAGKGRFYVYAYDEASLEEKWSQLDIIAGKNEIEHNVYDSFNQGIQLSDDGSTVAFGSPGNGYGLVQAFHIDIKKMTVKPKGQAIEGPAILSQFGYSLAFNFNGTRLFIGAPNYAVSELEISGLVRAYDYHLNTNSWVQIGSDMISKNSGSGFGSSVGSSSNGVKIIIGAPHDSTVFEDGGRLYFFTLNENNVWYHYPLNNAYGGMPGSRIGTILEVDETGDFAVTTMDKSLDELFPNAGTVSVYFFQKERSMIETLGIPISGPRQNAKFGRDVDITSKAGVLVVSEQNNREHAGDVQVYYSKFGYFEFDGMAIPGPPKGSCEPVAQGPSVSLASVTGRRLAIGYECILVHGLTKSAVHIYDIYRTDEQILQAQP
jgi:hypothetical protein